ncbi:dipeptidase [Streptomyces fungicidicus]|uniref:dipeptidase n=1 Tax=Streptomyces fungicidicus TaxID=68203 RepID=UPI003681A52E
MNSARVIPGLTSSWSGPWTLARKRHSRAAEGKEKVDAGGACLGPLDSVRIACIAHLGRTPLADGSGEDARQSAHHAGVKALAETERLDILFDVSHWGAAGVAHVLELATRPVWATHSGARALCNHHRNLTDAQLRGVAATGGVVCVNFYPEFLSADPAERTADRVVDHILRMADIIGIDCVGLGPGSGPGRAQRERALLSCSPSSGRPAGTGAA